MISHQSKFLGILYILISAISFGAMPIFARYAYKYQMNTQSILLFRFMIAFLFLFTTAILMKRKFPKGKDLFILILMGMLGYAGQSYSYFTALTLIPAPLVAILLYLYPVIVTFLSILFLNENLSLKTLIALFVAITGTFLVIGFQTGGDIKGIFWGLSAAFIYSIYILTGAKVMQKNDTFTSTVVILFSAMVVYLMMCVKNGLVMPVNIVCWANIFAIAFVSTALAIYTFFLGMTHIGAVNASMLSTFEPVTTVILAACFLGDKIGRLQIAGTILIIIAAIILAAKEK